MSRPILVVDDNERERNGVAALLRGQGYDVATASNGQEALDVVARQRQCLILLDMLMPSGDGWWFLEQRREDREAARIPVLVITGLAIATEAWARGVNAAGLIKKPIDVDELLEKVRRFTVWTAEG